MKLILQTVIAFFILSVFIGCGEKENKRDVFLMCEGQLSYINRNALKSILIDASSSFYVGKNFVEQDGKKYLICEDTKTKIEFADECIQNKKIYGSIDLIQKTIYVDKSLEFISANTQNYKCEIVKNPREQ